MAKYREADGRYVYKTTESYKGVTWECKGTSYKGAAQAKAAWQRNKEKRIALIDGTVDKKEGRICLERAMREWYDLYLRNKVIRGRHRPQTTIDTDMTTMSQIVDGLGNMQVCDIDSDVLQRYFNSLAEKGTGASVIRKQWVLFNQFFKKNRPYNNPMLMCVKPQTKSKHTLCDDDCETSTKTAYTDQEMAALTNVLLEHPAGRRVEQAAERGRLLTVIMWEFLRLGEAVELRVRDVDLTAGIIRIRRQYDERHKVVVIPKDNSKRDLPISGKCRSVIEAACAGKQPDELLFFGNESNGHEGRILRGALRDTLTAACEQAQIKPHHVHDLRHDGISYMVRRGAKPTSVQRWAGHKSLTVTLDIYYRDTGEDDPQDRSLMEAV